MRLNNHNFQVRKLARFSVKERPIFDPCLDCLVRVTCEELCFDKALYLKKEKSQKKELTEQKCKFKNVKRNSKSFQRENSI